MKALKASERVRGYRTRQRAAGLRLVQLWVPDTRARAHGKTVRRGDLAQIQVDKVTTVARERIGGVIGPPR